MLVHQLWNEISVIHELHHVLLHGILISSLLKLCEGAGAILSQAPIIFDLIYAVAYRHLFEK